MQISLPRMGSGIRAMNDTQVMGTAKVAGRLKISAANITRSSKVVAQSIGQQRAEGGKASGISRIDIKV